MAKLLVVRQGTNEVVDSISFRMTKKMEYGEYTLEDWDDYTDKLLAKKGRQQAKALTYVESYLESGGSRDFRNLPDKLESYFLIAWI